MRTSRCFRVQVRARIASIDSFSGHADKNELKGYVERIKGNLKKITVIHGEASQVFAFAETLTALRPDAEVQAPDYGQIMSF